MIYIADKPIEKQSECFIHLTLKFRKFFEDK